MWFDLGPIMRAVVPAAIASLLAVLAFAGLSGQWDAARFAEAPITGTGFEDHLARAYQDHVAAGLEREHDTKFAASTARRARRLLRGYDVQPVVLGDLNFGGPVPVHLHEARSALVMAVERFGTANPASCARAQAAFDAWAVLAAAESRTGSAAGVRAKPANLSKAADAFPAVTAQGAHRDFVARLTACGQLPLREISFRPAERTNRYTIHFAWNSTALTPLAEDVLDQIAAQARRVPNLAIEVTGHADRSAEDARSLEISLARAQAVADGLAARGVSADTVQGRGDSKPVVATADGVREPLNRRVDIRLRRP